MPIKIINNDMNLSARARRQGCPKKGRLMALDLGKKTIGVALSDDRQSIVTPLMTIGRKKLSQDLAILAEIVKEYEVRGFLLGWPLNMDGSMSGRCDAVRSFADDMLKAPDIFGHDPWIGLWDERLSTRSVDEFVDGRVDIGKKARQSAKESGLTDKLAAQFILNSFLNG